jgi:FAD/FMN-containing dehydrogenase
MPPPTQFRGLFRADPRARAAYAEGAGIHRIIPEAVAVPVDLDDLRALVRWAAANRVALVPRGAGSSMGGGAVGDGVIVDLTSISPRRLEIDPGQRIAWTSGSVTVTELNEAASRHGLRMPVEPSSARWATLAGMVACNAAGARTVKHGAVRRWVNGLELVTADGETGWTYRSSSLPLRPTAPPPLLQRFETDCAPALRAQADAIRTSYPRTAKNAAGYGLDAWLDSGDAVDLLVGSEGTLAFITGIEWGLEPVPAARSALRIALSDLGQLGEVVPVLRKLDPSAVELLDRTFLDLVRRARGADALPGIPGSAQAVLLVEFERATPAAARGAAGDAVRMVAPWSTEVETALTPAQEEGIWALRHAASPILAGLSDQLRSVQLIEDGCVPVDRLGEYLQRLRAAASAQGVEVVIFGHAGDGHVHVNVLADLEKPGWKERVTALFETVSETVIGLGGTVAGEHGVGRLRAGLLERQYGAATVAAFGAVKQAFDPAGILNPGVILLLHPRPSGSPLGPAPPVSRLKFGDGAAVLPDDVARALREIERTGGYARDRLTLAGPVPDPQPPSTS